MTLLSVNVNKIATLRNARGADQPHLLQMSQDIVSFGATSLTVHPRPDERHITRQDAYSLGAWIKTNNGKIEYNMEGFPDDRFLNMVEEIQPTQCTLVPDSPHILTSNAGWNCEKNKTTLMEVCEKLRQWHVRSSLFIDPFELTRSQLEALKSILPDRVELYTEKFAKNFGTPQQEEVTKVYQKAAEGIQNLGIQLNAGHDLNQKNLPTLIDKIPFLKEVSIGHALICEALYDGLEKTVKKYLEILACR